MADWDWNRVVFDHVKLTVSDPEATKVVLPARCWPTLEIPPIWENERGGQYANLVVVGPGEPSTPIHIGFVARTRDEVDAFHAAGLAAGYRDNGAPGVREQYSSEAAGLYYAAFLLDPDGNNIEAVHRSEYPAAA